jgi:hypothetical protein
VVVGTGSAVRPVILCLSALGFTAQPIRRSRHLDGLKLFRLSRALIFDLASLRSFGAKSGPGHWPDAPTRVAAHGGFRDCPLFEIAVRQFLPRCSTTYAARSLSSTGF